MNQIMSSSYQSFAEIGDDNHVLIHVLPSESKGPRPWTQYIHNLDFFFTNVYNYHRRSGFACLIINQILELIQFIFVVVFTIFLIHCVDYSILFKNNPQGSNTKVHIKDAILPLNSIRLSSLEVVILIVATIFWTIKLFRLIQSIFVNLAIKSFYTEALHISDCSSYTWQEVQTRLIQAQHLCLIQEGQLNELDVHNRILRHANYMIALCNKGLLPIHYKVPFIGEVTFLTKGLQFNLKLLLFSGPLAFFENSYKLRDQFKSSSKRQACADLFAKHCLWLAGLNLVLFPLIFMWQILHTFYEYAETLKRDPSIVLGSRSWSLYTRWYCRHFNELDHQLNDRLSRGYKAATKYLNSFTSPMAEIISQHIVFMAGSMLAVLICLTIYDEDVIQVEHIITVMTGLGAMIAISRAFIRSEVPLKHTQTELYAQILEHLHYVPHGYPPFSPQARTAMSNLFQYRIIVILEELISPLVTPYVLLRHMSSRSLEIVDFFRNFTVELQGIGDVCTFSMLNIKENGNPHWQTKGSEQKQSGYTNIKLGSLPNTTHTPQTLATVPEDLVTFDGKLELSLINFKLTNPNWHPYNESQQEFIQFITSQAVINERNNSIQKESTSSLTRSQMSPITSFSEKQIEKSSFSLERSRILNDSSFFLNPNDEMSLSTLYLHEHAKARLNEISHYQPQAQTERDPLLAPGPSSIN